MADKKFKLRSGFRENKGLRQFVLKTFIFVVFFILISFIIGQKILETNLLNNFYIYIYGGMGYILLFSFLGFILLYRSRLTELTYFIHEKKSVLFLIISFFATIMFYIVELNVFRISNSLTNILLIHLFFLSIFFFLGLGVFEPKFTRYFFGKFKFELLYFLIFGGIIYSLMNLVWKAWPYLSLIVLKINYFLLDLIGDTKLINQYTIYFNGFGAEIGEACSGVYSIFIFASLYIFVSIIDWKKLNKKKVAILFVPVVVGAFLVNVFRVFILFIVGAFVSKTAAFGLYHSYAGMIFFLVYFAAFWILFYEWMKKPEFRRKDSFVLSLYKKVMKDSLYRNSIYLMVSTFIMAVFGFVFWMIVARLFSTHDVGIATSIISVMGIICGLSVLGLNAGLIRYLPNSKDKSTKINTCFTLVTLVSIVVSSIYLAGINFFSPSLIFIKENVILSFVFIFFVIFAGLNSLVESIFIAYRNTKPILIKNTVFSILKFLIIFYFVFLGAFGIFTSWMISMIAGFFVALGILVWKYNYKPKFTFHDSIMRQIGKYSFGNYIAGFIGGLPALVLPILILNMVGSSVVAYYYMSMMIAALLFIIPQATSNSLFAEGSFDENSLKIQIKKSFKIISILLAIGIPVVIFLGKYILLLFGSEYSISGTPFLEILAVSAVFVSVNSVGENILKIKKRVRTFIWINAFKAVLILGLALWFMVRTDLGLLGVGYAWLMGQGIVSLWFLGGSLGISLLRKL